MKKLLSMILCIVMLLSLSAPALAVEGDAVGIFEGSGTEDDPYLISTKEQLDAVRNDLTTHYKLINDIVFEDSDFTSGGAFYNDGSGWLPIGSDEAKFSGTFDGAGYAIKNLYINVITDSTVNVGLFCENSGTIKNLGIEGGSISYANENNTGARTYCGAIVGENYYGTVINCYNTSSVSVTAMPNGVPYSHVAGVVGANYYGTVSGCYNTGTITGVSAYAGGVVGDNINTVENCYNIGNVSSSYSVSGHTVYAGGIVGENRTTNGKITYSYNAGNITKTGSSVYSGGIVGYNYNGYMTNCYYLDNSSSALGSGSGSSTVYKCTAEQLKQQSTFSGFDFDTVWSMNPTDGYVLPELVENPHSVSANNTTEFGSGSGTWPSPYVVSTKEHLNNVRNYPSAYFIMTNDIEFTDADFASDGAFYNDGAGWTPIESFAGNFDGNGYAVKNIKINIAATSTTKVTATAGIFASNSGTIINLELAGGSITAAATSSGSFSTDSANVRIGGIVADNTGTVTNCESSCTISGSAKSTDSCTVNVYIGGIAASNTGTITECSYSGSISGTASSDSNEYAYVGGIVGDNNAGTVTGCANSGNIVESTSRASYRNAACGGIAGKSDNGAVSSCSNTGNITGDEYTGGIVGRNTSPVSGCYNKGTISCSSTAGGIAGYNNYGTTVSNCYNEGTVTAPTDAQVVNLGGVAGENRGTVTRCYNKGTISGVPNATKATNVYVGGVAGDNEGTVSDCYNTGDVTANANSSSSSNVNAYGGGVVGYSIGTVTYCYNIGTASASAEATMYGSTATKYAGAIVAYKSSGTVTDTYFLDNMTSGIGYGAGTASQRTAAQLKLAETFTGFDFDTVWTMDGNSDYLYPELQGVEMIFTKNLTGITVKAPTKTQYIVGDTALDLTDGAVIAEYDNGTSGEIPMTADMVSGFDSSTMGEKTITVTYEGKTAQFEITVIHAFAGGSGTETDPYLIATAEQLNNVRVYLDAHYKLTNDIEFAEADFDEGGAYYNDGKCWLPIGTSTNPFTGVFDGAGYSIENIALDYNHNQIEGLFDTNDGTIKNLTLSGEILFSDVAGGIAGRNNGFIDNCVNKANISSKDSFFGIRDIAGGITAYNYGTITNCRNEGAISTKDEYDTVSAGIAAYNYGDAVVSNCVNTGEMICSATATTGSNGYAAGIVGYNYANGTVEACYNIAKIDARATTTSTANYGTGPSAYSGGIVGSNQGTVTACYNTAEVFSFAFSSSSYITTYEYRGGIAGYSTGTIADCYNTGKINETCYVTDSYKEYAGAIVAYNSSGTVTDTYFLDNMTSGIGYGAGTASQRTAAQLKLAETFTGFDFDTVWTMGGNSDYLYPELQGVEMIFTKNLTGITVKAPTKTQYIVGDTALDLTDGAVIAEYDNGCTEEIEITSEMVSGFDSSVTGENTITVTYNGFTTTFTVDILPSGTCGENLTWVLTNEGVLTISGTGAMDDYSIIEGSSWGEHKSSITSIVIEEGVTTIGNYAFAHCYELTNILIPNSIVSIGDAAFNACYKLTSISIPYGVTSISDHTFFQCFALEGISIHDNITSIGCAAFVSCSTLTSITIPDSITSIDSRAFENSALTSITFEGNAPEISEEAFTGVTADAYYHPSKTGWDETTLIGYGGTLTWYPLETAMIGDTCYETLADALADAQDGDTVTLLLNASVSETLVIGKSVTLDGAGHTITSSAETGISIADGVDVSICDLTLLDLNGCAITIGKKSTVDFTDASIFGITALNITGENSVVTATSCDFAGSNTASAVRGAIEIDGKYTTLVVLSGSIVASAADSCEQYPFLVRDISEDETTIVIKKTTITKVSETDPDVKYLTVSAPVIKIGDTEYTSVSAALAAAKSGDVVKLYSDAAETIVSVTDGVTLDLNGYTLTANYVFGVKGADVIDTPRTGLLKVDVDNIVLSTSNSMLPIWDNTAGGFVFSNAIVDDYNEGLGKVLDEENNIANYSFVTYFNSNGRALLGDAETGADDNNVKIVVRLTWETTQGVAYQDFVYNKDMVSKVVTANGGQKYTLAVKNYQSLNNLTITAMVLSDTHTEFTPVTD